MAANSRHRSCHSNQVRQRGSEEASRVTENYHYTNNTLKSNTATAHRCVVRLTQFDSLLGYEKALGRLVDLPSKLIEIYTIADIH